ncbi:hypothetical protein [Neolewinella antarctica]|uniref:Lipoprotein n=1 Tax=Neolewinella antarctica TaxID=442734 RepID=A0ABX0X9X6_9BACT|nr:hypothetical protein [Neolewinella antarctica]NJC26037.1 hypothetical protein [Neolewinella antarctica]
MKRLQLYFQLTVAMVVLTVASACRDGLPPPSSTNDGPTRLVDVSIGSLGIYGSCQEDLEGVEDVIIEFTVNSVDLSGVSIEEIYFEQERVSNSLFDLYSKRYPLRIPRLGLFTLETTVTFSCATCCSGQGPMGGDPNGNACGTAGGGVRSNGQARFSENLPMLDSGSFPTGLVSVEPKWRRCFSCGCSD